MRHIPDYFARWRARNRLTIAEAAERLFITQRDVELIEAGRKVSPPVAFRVNHKLKYPAARCKGKRVMADAGD